MKIKNVILIPLLYSTLLFGVENFEGKKVSKIDIQFERYDPKHAPNPSTILKKLQTQEGEDFSQIEFDGDLKQLAGDFDQVEPNVSMSDGEVVITLKVWPKPIIHQIYWEGNQIFSDKKLQKELGVKPNSIFNRAEFTKKLTKLQEFLNKKGYFESELTYQIEPITGTNQVDISIKVEEGRTGKIKKILFEGLNSSERRALTEKMYTKKYNLFVSWFTGSGILQEEALEQDRMTIVSFLQDEGYADAKVDVAVLDDPETNRVIVKITAHRGEVYHFGNVNIKGNTLFDEEEIKQRILTQPESPYSTENLRLSLEAIKSLYGRSGYIDTNVQYETRLREDSRIFDIDYYIVEGEKFKIGLIRVVGNSSTQSNVILRESLLVPGEVFDARKLEATQKRLENVGYFKDVNVYAVKSSESLGLGSEYRDVYIEVEETTTGNVNMFLGLSSSDSVYGGLELTERNFNILGIGDAFTDGISNLRGGGEYVHVRASIGKSQSNYLVSWMDPYVKDSLWRLGFEISKTTSTLQKEYDTDTYGFSVFAGYPLTTFWTFNSKYRLRYTDTDIRKKGASSEARAFENSGILGGLGCSFVYDSTDNAFKPHRGIRSTIEGEYVGLGGKFFFTKAGYVNSLYFPLWSKGTLKARADFRFIYPFFGEQERRVPVSERFFLGGVGSVRGYKPYILGPKDPATNQALGGISSGLLSLEYSQEIFKFLDAFAFFDAGHISNNIFSLTPSQFRTSTGVGLRIELMNRTPIIVGYGIPFNAKKDEKEKFFFSMGGQF